MSRENKKPELPGRGDWWSRFVPLSIRDLALVQRARLLVRFGGGFGFFNMGFVPILFLLSAPEGAVVVAVTTTIMTGSPFILRWTGSLTFAANVFIAATVGLFGGTSFLFGGLDAPTVPVLAVAPIAAVFLLGRRAGFFWSIVVIAIVAALAAMPRLGFPLELYIAPRSLPLLKTIGMITLVIVSLIFVLLYDSTKNDALAAVRHANQRMVAMIAHLDATSAALSRSAAEFLGSALTVTSTLPDDGITYEGLTQQMLSTADSSRQMIGDVGASIHGMITQYEAISARIQELHQQSGTIAGLVKAIDSISDRLDLMALNLGIEAAHAGESGKRFQLLADDMRRLAERVLDETQRIKTSIRRVQNHTQAAIDASHAGQALTNEGTEQLAAMSRAFDDMHRLIERTAEASQQITNDTIAQLATIHDLVSESLHRRDLAD